MIPPPPTSTLFPYTTLFRSHTNRQLRGLVFDPEPPMAPVGGWNVVTHVDRDVGRVTSLAFVPDTGLPGAGRWIGLAVIDRKSTRLNSSHSSISYAVFCLKKK